MDRLLRPAKLEVLPKKPEATRIYDHWLKSFDTFQEAVRAAAENTDNINKLGLLKVKRLLSLPIRLSMRKLEKRLIALTTNERILHLAVIYF